MTWKGTVFYPVCVGYRLMHTKGVHVTRNAKLQAMMSEASKYFYISKNAKVISTKHDAIKVKKMRSIGKDDQEQYRVGTFRLRNPIQNSDKWTISLHRLVMYTFRPILHPEDFHVDHVKRGDKNEYFREHDFDPAHGSSTVRSNRVEHLRWVTAKENSQTRNKIYSGAQTKYVYPILATNLMTGETMHFESIAKALKFLNQAHADTTFRRNCIGDVLRKRLQSHKGYHFEKVVPTLQGEKWKDVPQTKTKISNFGRIFNARGISKCSTDHVKNGLEYTRTRLSYRKHKTGPVVVKYKSVHRLVYEAFCGPIKEGMLIDHKDGYGQHNCLENIRMVTRSENGKNCGQRSISRGKCEFCGFDRGKGIMGVLS